MPCSDCVQIKPEIAALKEFVSHWFDIFFKEFKSLDNQISDLRLFTEEHSKSLDSKLENILIIQKEKVETGSDNVRNAVKEKPKQTEGERKTPKRRYVALKKPRRTVPSRFRGFKPRFPLSDQVLEPRRFESTTDFSTVTLDPLSVERVASKIVGKPDHQESRNLNSKELHDDGEISGDSVSNFTWIKQTQSNSRGSSGGIECETFSRTLLDLKSEQPFQETQEAYTIESQVFEGGTLENAFPISCIPMHPDKNAIHPIDGVSESLPVASEDQVPSVSMETGPTIDNEKGSEEPYFNHDRRLFVNRQRESTSDWKWTPTENCRLCSKPICTKDITLKKRHVSMHLGIKAYKCGVCEMSSARPCPVRFHMKKFHQLDGTPTFCPDIGAEKYGELLQAKLKECFD